MDGLSQIITQFVKEPQVAFLLMSYAFAIVAFYRGWVVPKFIYDASEARSNSLSKSLAEVTEALKDLTTEIRQRAGR
jgi:hypothetical protein